MMPQTRAERPGDSRTALLVALILVLLGLFMLVAGVSILLGTGWALITAGTGLIVFAILADLSRLTR